MYLDHNNISENFQLVCGHTVVLMTCVRFYCKERKETSGEDVVGRRNVATAQKEYGVSACRVFSTN